MKPATNAYRATAILASEGSSFWMAVDSTAVGKGISADVSEPTILTDVKKGMPAYDEELFGPVAVVIVVPNEARAIEVANDGKYGLGGSVYTRDLERGRRVAQAIEAGMVYINHPAYTYEDMPFGGSKNPAMAAKPANSASTNS